MEVEDAEVGLGEDCEDAVSNVGNNADLYTANQESTDLINEAHMGAWRTATTFRYIRFMSQDVLYFQPLSLD